MTIDGFVLRYNGTTVGDGQCVALIKAYERDVYGFTEYYGLTYAYEWYTQYFNNQGLQNHYDIYSVGDGLPSKGDIIVWSNATGGGAGHLEIVLSDISPTGFTSFGQNWIPNTCAITNHTWNHVLGYLKPKGSPGPEPPGPGPGPTPGESGKGKNYKRWLYSNKTKYRLT